MNLSFSEIKKWDKFEDLVAAYLRKLKDDNSNNILEVDVKPPGKGADGGRDILVTFRVDDSLTKFERRWVIQCKFYKNSVSTKQLSDINIPSLIHQYNANGYLLICKNDVTKTTTNMFEALAQNCSFKYQYLIWTGEDFLERLYNLPSIQQQFFPKYYQSIKKASIQSKKNKN